MLVPRPCALPPLQTLCPARTLATEHAWPFAFTAAAALRRCGSGSGTPACGATVHSLGPTPASVLALGPGPSAVDMELNFTLARPPPWPGPHNITASWSARCALLNTPPLKCRSLYRARESTLRPVWKETAGGKVTDIHLAFLLRFVLAGRGRKQYASFLRYAL